MSYTYEYPRPALTVDGVVFSRSDDGVKILLIRRANEPFKGQWALPGGFVDMTESAYDAVRRELEEETGLRLSILEQLHTFSSVDRDPRERVVCVSYLAVLPLQDGDPELRAGDDAREACWTPVDKLPPLAFDHAEIVRMGLAKLDEINQVKDGGSIPFPESVDLEATARIVDKMIDQSRTPIEVEVDIGDRDLTIQGGDALQDGFATGATISVTEGGSATIQAGMNSDGTQGPALRAEPDGTFWIDNREVKTDEEIRDALVWLVDWMRNPDARRQELETELSEARKDIAEFIRELESRKPTPSEVEALAEELHAEHYIQSGQFGGILWKEMTDSQQGYWLRLALRAVLILVS